MKFSVTSTQILFFITLTICCQTAVCSVGNSCTYDSDCGNYERCSLITGCVCKSGYVQYGTSCGIDAATLGAGVIVAIIFGVIGPLVCCILIIWCVCRRRRQPGVVVHNFPSQPQPQAAPPIVVNTQYQSAPPSTTNCPMYPPQGNPPEYSTQQAPSNPSFPAYKY